MGMLPWLLLLSIVGVVVMKLNHKAIEVPNYANVTTNEYKNFMSNVYDTSNSVCWNEHCGQFSYDTILKLFPNYFYTRKRLQEMERRDRQRRDIGGSTTLCDDSDQCCPTILVYSNASQLINEAGELRDIIQLYDHNPPSYQLIPIGFCSYQGSCASCIVKYRSHTLLVLDKNFDPPIYTFDIFLLPSYCLCA